MILLIFFFRIFFFWRSWNTINSKRFKF
jgi:hypothetical protein